MAWRPAKSIVSLRDQVNALCPNRSKASDGLIGDAAHSARASDHNPDKQGIVRAIDFTNDPAGGCDAQKLADALVASRDPRIKYIISRGRIISGSGQKQAAWKWRPYSGTNKHDKHVHISVKAGVVGDAAGPWNLGSFGAAKGTEAKSGETLVRGMTGKYVHDLQTNLETLGYYSGKIDGVFGKGTEDAVKAFQAHAKLLVDGKAGIRTNTEIGIALKAKETKPQIAAAKKVVEPQAQGGVSANQIGAGLISAVPTVEAARRITDEVSSGVTSLASLSPWIIAALCGIGLASYIFWNEHQKRKAAQKAMEALP